MTTIVRYTKTAIILHWAIAVLILINVILGLSADRVPDEFVRRVVDLHKSIGILVLGLACLRIFWRSTHKPPSFQGIATPFEALAAHIVHGLLYVLIFALPLTGWIHDSAWSGASTHPMFLFATIPWFRLSFIMSLDASTKESIHGLFGALHTYAGYVLYCVLGLHVTAVIKHYLIDKQPILNRIWFKHQD